MERLSQQKVERGEIQGEGWVVSNGVCAISNDSARRRVCVGSVGDVGHSSPGVRNRVEQVGAFAPEDELSPTIDQQMVSNCHHGAKHSQVERKLSLRLRVGPSPRLKIQNPEVVELSGVVVEISIPISSSKDIQLVVQNFSCTRDTRYGDLSSDGRLGPGEGIRIEDVNVRRKHQSFQTATKNDNFAVSHRSDY